MIVAEGLTKQFNGFTAVSQLDLAVEQGQLLALLGPNGAGKTTTVRMLSAILQPTDGRAAIAGFDVVSQAQEVRRNVGLLTEQPGLYTRSTGLEYLTFFGRLYGMPDEVSRTRALAFFERFAMRDTAHRRLGEYSKGMRQKVGLIRAMLHDPPVLLLDEPTSAMDPHSAHLVRQAVTELRDGSRAIVVCTHNLAEAELLADQIAIIRQGRIVALGTIAQLKRQLIGRALFELRLDRQMNSRVPELDELVTLEWTAADTARYYTADPRLTNPQLVHRLSGLGLGVVTLRELTISLEEVYLKAVTEDEA
jgi:ABC-2 type transport system ATP-binding protein